MKSTTFKVGDRVKIVNPFVAPSPTDTHKVGTIVRAPKTTRGHRYLVVVDGLSLNGKLPEECPQDLHEIFLDAIPQEASL